MHMQITISVKEWNLATQRCESVCSLWSSVCLRQVMEHFWFVKLILKALLVNMYNGYSDGAFTVIAHTYAKIAKVTLIPWSVRSCKTDPRACIWQQTTTFINLAFLIFSPHNESGNEPRAVCNPMHTQGWCVCAWHTYLQPLPAYTLSFSQLSSALLSSNFSLSLLAIITESIHTYTWSVMLFIQFPQWVYF